MDKNGVFFVVVFFSCSRGNQVRKDTDNDVITDTV